MLAESFAIRHYHSPRITYLPPSLPPSSGPPLQFVTLVSSRLYVGVLGPTLALSGPCASAPLRSA